MATDEVTSVLRNGRGRIKCYVEYCPSWAIVWRYLYYDPESSRRYLPVCALDDPMAFAPIDEGDTL